MIKQGDKAAIEKIFSQEEVIAYAKSSNDNNPVHFDPDYAEKTPFAKPIVHGMLAASLFGGLLGSDLPGKGTIHLGQELKFIKPVMVGEKVLATIEVTHIREDKPVFTFDCILTKEDGSVAIQGTAVVIFRGEVFK
ncbi:MAG: MaoC family dehydratase [Bacteroidales bacterium]|jgi:acyl dehydratase|nr:MaoC family dehydratase [Bacteroidales bacterium]MDD4214469.1 MaoC family dehydratase [Bacteroidales bacterium]